VHIRSLMMSLGFASALGACAATNIDEEQRSIGVETGAVPAAATTSPAHVRGLVKKASPSYVTLSVTQDDGNTSVKQSEKSRRALTSGSGFVVESSGYIMTAAHVGVEKGNIVSARAADGRIYAGSVVAVLPTNDMALVKLKSFQGPAVTPASNACLARGSEVFSLGKPFAQGDIARVGSVESMHFGRAVRYGRFGYPDALVLHMDTKKGESGGPLFNDDGQLAGMIVSTLADGNGKSLSLAHAIPVTQLADFLCKTTSCSGPWQAIAAQTTDSCGS
jgi:S1-C subfamily serine protease